MKPPNKPLVKLPKPRQSLEQVSELTTNRLSVYLRCLNQLEGAGVRTISSQALAEQFHLNAAQIRKDLAYFGEFGVRGVGYYVRDLKRHLRQILGLDRKLRVAIIGAGNLGLALADYPGFRQEGFEIAVLERVLESISVAAQRIGALVVTGDTKVVPRGAADQLFINTTGIGEIFGTPPAGPAARGVADAERCGETPRVRMLRRRRGGRPLRMTGRRPRSSRARACARTRRASGRASR